MTTQIDRLPYDEAAGVHPSTEQGQAPTPRPMLRMPYRILAVVAALVVLGLSGWHAYSAHADEVAADQFSVTIGPATAPVTVDVYLDFMCPACGQFERVSGATLQKAALVDGTARVRVHTMNFLDRASSGTDYSTRAANAFTTVAHEQPDIALAFAQALYEHQPNEGTAGLTDAQIAQYARSCGASEATVSKFAAGIYTDFVEQVNASALAHGIHSTPTVLVNGKQVSNPSRPGVIGQAIVTAR